MILYTVPGSCGFASQLALEMSGAEHETRLAPRTGGKTAPAFYEINPKGRVPALVTSEGIITETTAILCYVAQTHPQAKLAPFDEPWLFARLQSFCAYLCATVHVAHAHGHRGYRWAIEESSFKDMTRKTSANMTECFELIASEMLEGTWVLGDRFSLGDIYLLTLARWLEADNCKNEGMRKQPRVSLDDFLDLMVYQQKLIQTNSAVMLLHIAH